MFSNQRDTKNKILDESLDDFTQVGLNAIQNFVNSAIAGDENAVNHLRLGFKYVKDATRTELRREGIDFEIGRRVIYGKPDYKDSEEYFLLHIKHILTEYNRLDKALDSFIQFWKLPLVNLVNTAINFNQYAISELRLRLEHLTTPARTELIKLCDDLASEILNKSVTEEEIKLLSLPETKTALTKDEQIIFSNLTTKQFDEKKLVNKKAVLGMLYFHLGKQEESKLLLNELVVKDTSIAEFYKNNYSVAAELGDLDSQVKLVDRSDTYSDWMDKKENTIIFKKISTAFAYKTGFKRNAFVLEGMFEPFLKGISLGSPFSLLKLADRCESIYTYRNRAPVCYQILVDLELDSMAYIKLADHYNYRFCHLASSLHLYRKALLKFEEDKETEASKEIIVKSLKDKIKYFCFPDNFFHSNKGSRYIKSLVLLARIYSDILAKPETKVQYRWTYEYSKTLSSNGIPIFLNLLREEENPEIYTKFLKLLDLLTLKQSVMTANKYSFTAIRYFLQQKNLPSSIEEKILNYLSNKSLIISKAEVEKRLQTYLLRQASTHLFWEKKATNKIAPKKFDNRNTLMPC